MDDIDWDPNDPNTQPLPQGGWSETVTVVRNATVVPPAVSAFVQEAGVLDADGAYVPQGALWRRFRPITVEPAQPAEIAETIPGRWLWGGVLWVHFGHFLVESTSRLWGLAELDGPVYGVLFIPKRPKVGETVQPYHRHFMDLMTPELPIRVATSPARVEELVVPGQGFGIGKIMAGTDKFRTAIHERFAREVQPDGPERLYISRSALGLGKGGLLGEELLESLLEREGYEIFHPQKHPMRTQIARYKAARQIVAADGSALHLYAMVGRADQRVAMISRRESGAKNQLALNVASFCGREPVLIDALRTEWVRADRGKSDRLSFGELDHVELGRRLADAGFVEGGRDWPALSERQRRQILADRRISGESGFVESPEFKRRRIRRERRARRTAREAARAR